jgi:hypothetical protein
MTILFLGAALNEVLSRMMHSEAWKTGEPPSEENVPDGPKSS